MNSSLLIILAFGIIATDATVIIAYLSDTVWNRLTGFSKRLYD